jgi:peptidoglycan/xylan/chitin deacetylase (PgdA/CDA1 family)
MHLLHAAFRRVEDSRQHFLFDRPPTSVTAVTTSLIPDLVNYSWRDYGVRVGMWRMMDVMEKHGIKGTVALNSDVCRHYPRIIEGGKHLVWEWIGHGNNVHADRPPVRGRVKAADQGRRRHHQGGHRSATTRLAQPALSESHRTLDILAQNGIQYVGNWVNDEQPYPMRVRAVSPQASCWPASNSRTTRFCRAGCARLTRGRQELHGVDGHIQHAETCMMAAPITSVGRFSPRGLPALA